MSIRDNLATRSPEYDEKYPEALDLEGRCYEAAHPEIRGVMATLSGTSSEDDFRKLLRGKVRPGLDLKNLCRLRLSNRPEAQRATDAILSVLLHAGPRAATAPVTFEALAKLIESASGVTAGLTRDLATGGAVDADEATRRLPDARRLAAQLSIMVGELERIAGGAR